MILRYLLLYIVVLSLAVAASRFVPWWGSLIIIPATLIGLIWFTWWRIKRFFRKAVTVGLEMAGHALKGATVTVHRVSAAERPEFDDDEDIEYDDELTRPTRWVSVEMTVRPDPTLTAPSVDGVDEDDFDDDIDDWRYWEPSTFVLVGADAPDHRPGQKLVDYLVTPTATPHLIEQLSDDGETVVAFRNLFVDDEEFDGDPVLPSAEDDDALDDQSAVTDVDHHAGSCRVRIIFGVPDAIGAQAKLRYATHDFAFIDLP